MPGSPTPRQSMSFENLLVNAFPFRIPRSTCTHPPCPLRPPCLHRARSLPPHMPPHPLPCAVGGAVPRGPGGAAVQPALRPARLAHAPNTHQRVRAPRLEALPRPPPLVTESSQQAVDRCLDTISLLHVKVQCGYCASGLCRQIGVRFDLFHCFINSVLFIINTTCAFKISFCTLHCRRHIAAYKMQ